MSSAVRLVLMLYVIALNSVTAYANEEKTVVRLVSVGGSVTEILFAVGAKPHIVATDTSSLYPIEAQELPKVGYYRQLSIEGVLSLEPTKLFAANGAGPSSVLEQLKNAGVNVSVFEQPKTVPGLMSLIREVGQAAGLQTNANMLANKIEEQLIKVTNISQSSGARVVFLMSASDRGLMAAGANTVPNLIMEIAGVENPYNMIDGFQPVSVESFLAINPTHVLITSHRTGGMSAQDLCKQAILKQWAASQGCNLHIVDPLLFLGMTPRLPIAVKEFASFVVPAKYVGSE
jgi:iron complex transport system substrate-binding protein